MILPKVEQRQAPKLLAKYDSKWELHDKVEFAEDGQSLLLSCVHRTGLLFKRSGSNHGVVISYDGTHLKFEPVDARQLWTTSATIKVAADNLHEALRIVAGLRSQPDLGAELHWPDKELSWLSAMSAAERLLVERYVKNLLATRDATPEQRSALEACLRFKALQPAGFDLHHALIRLGLDDKLDEVEALHQEINAVNRSWNEFDKLKGLLRRHGVEEDELRGIGNALPIALVEAIASASVALQLLNPTPELEVKLKTRRISAHFGILMQLSAAMNSSFMRREKVPMAGTFPEPELEDADWWMPYDVLIPEERAKRFNDLAPKAVEFTAKLHDEAFRQSVLNATERWFKHQRGSENEEEMGALDHYARTLYKEDPILFVEGLEYR